MGKQQFKNNWKISLFEMNKLLAKPRSKSALFLFISTKKTFEFTRSEVINFTSQEITVFEKMTKLSFTNGKISSAPFSSEVALA